MKPSTTAALLVAAGLLGNAAPTQAQSPTAEDLYAEARSLVQERKFEAALARLRAAYALKQSHDIAGNLGLIEAELGLAVPAVEHLEHALRVFPVSGKPEVRATFEQKLVEVQRRVGTIELRVDRSGAEVLLDDVRLGLSPLDRPLVVEPHQHRIEVKMEGYRTERAWVVPAAGTKSIVDLTLVPDRPGASTTTNEPTADPWSDGGVRGASGFDAARPWLVGASGVLVAAGLAFGITGTVLSSGHASEFETLREELGDGSCVGGQVPDVCLPLGEQLALESATQSLAIGGFVAAGLGVALGLTFLLVPSSQPDASATAELSLQPRGAELRARF